MTIKTDEKLYKTGELAPVKGIYQFVRYTDGTTTPSPTYDELRIPLDKGDKFPPVGSTNKACWRKQV